MRVGRLTNLLLTPDWVRRRKESVELLGDVWLQRSMSVEFAVPPEMLTTLDQFRAGQLHLPLFVLPRAPAVMMDFSLRHRSGRPALPLREENSLAAFDSLLQQAEHVLRPRLLDDGQALPVSIRRDLLAITHGALEDAAEVARALATPARPRLSSLTVQPDLDEAEEALAALHRRLFSHPPEARPDAPENAAQVMRRTLAGDPEFRWLLFTYSRASPILVAIDDLEGLTNGDVHGPIERVHLSYKHNLLKSSLLPRVQRLGWAAVPLVVECTYVAARTFHLEFQAPEGLEVVDSQPVLVVPDPGTFGPTPGEEARPQPVSADYRDEPLRGSRVHLYLEDADRLNPLVATLQLRVARESFAGSAVFPALAVFLVILAITVLAEPLIRHADGGVSLLLIFPALLVASVGRAGGHLLVVRTLTGARRLLLFSGVLAFLSAALLPLVPTGEDCLEVTPFERWYWAILAGLATVPVAGLWLTRKLPRPRHRQGALERWLRRASHVVGLVWRFRQDVLRRRIKVFASVDGMARTDWKAIVDTVGAVIEHSRIRLGPVARDRARLRPYPRVRPLRIAARDTSRRRARHADFTPRLDVVPARRLRSALLALEVALAAHAATRRTLASRLAVALRRRVREQDPGRVVPGTPPSDHVGLPSVVVRLQWTKVKRPPRRHPSLSSLANALRASDLMNDTMHVVTEDQHFWLGQVLDGVTRFHLSGRDLERHRFRFVDWRRGRVWRSEGGLFALVHPKTVKAAGGSRGTTVVEVRRSRHLSRACRQASTSRHQLHVLTLPPDTDLGELSCGRLRRALESVRAVAMTRRVPVEIQPLPDRRLPLPGRRVG